MISAKVTSPSKKSVEEHCKKQAEKVRKNLLRAGAFLLRESNKLVPVDTGALRRSGTITLTSKNGIDTVTVSYTMHYAIYVHEDLEASHKPGKSAKFLEIPFKRYYQKIRRMILGGKE